MPSNHSISATTRSYNFYQFFLKKIFHLKKLLKTKIVRQTSVLYLSQISTLFLGTFIGAINTRHLGPKDYGIYSFILSVITFTSLFFEFGFFTAGARLMAVTKNETKERELIGSLIIVTILISLTFSFCIFILSLFIDSWFKTQIGPLMRILFFLCAIFPFQYLIQQICKGSNQIKKLSLYTLLPKTWYLSGVLILISLFGLNVLSALLLNISGIIFSALIIITSIKPTFKNFKANLKLIGREVKEYGFKVYLGRVADLATYDSDKMLIGYFWDTTSVGFYSLGTMLISPITTLSRSMSISLFKGFADSVKIPIKVIYFNFLWLFCCSLGLIGLGRYLIILLFSKKFLGVKPLLLPLVMCGFFRGLYQPYNMFLAAKRKGEYLQIVSFCLTGINLICNFALIPKYGAIGAAYASFLAVFSSYLLYIYYYRSTIIESNRNTER